MRQQTLAEEGYEKYRKPTRRERFLEEMDRIIPWTGLCDVIGMHAPRAKDFTNARGATAIGH